MIKAYTSGATLVFEVLREAVPIERLIETNGHRKALCVSHPEMNPSLHVYEDYVHCYGCGLHCDVTDLWAAQKGIERPIEAALDLARRSCLEALLSGPYHGQPLSRSGIAAGSWL